LCKSEFEKQMEAAQEARPSHENEFTWLIESIRCAIDDCLRLTGWSHIDYKARLQDIVVTHEAHGTLRLRDLSDGIRGMIALVGDIAYRATRLNPHLQFSAARESPGIILIDEIDLHLHPEWQQGVVNDLAKTFPNMQFIVTTHSPDVVSSVSRECVRRLRWRASQDELEHYLPQACFDYDGAVLIAEIPDHETEGEQVSSVASDVFGVDAWPDLPIVHDLRRYRSLVDQGLYDGEEALALRERLIAHYGADHEELAAAEISIAGQRARRAAQGA
jgi:predicted ATP-binding protein involved in virulence